MDELPYEDDAIGVYSFWGFVNLCVFLIVPFAYLYVALILLREVCLRFPETVYRFLQTYIPFLANLVMQKSSQFVEIWCWIEAIFFIVLKGHITLLQLKDPLEASLKSAPMMEADQRQVLWNRMMDTEKEDPATFISGWFFDEPITNISRHDVRDFITWSMYEGRHQEHLTEKETAQLEGFVEELEWRMSLWLYGEVDDEIMLPSLQETKGDPLATDGSNNEPSFRPCPKQYFRFHENTPDGPPNFFSNLYENYKQRYEQYRNMIENADFRPVQDFRNFMADAEENALATATHMYENAYNTLVSPGSTMDKQLAAFGHATHVRVNEAWNSMKGIRERLETAEFLTSQRRMISQKLKGYRVVLDGMLQMSSAVPSAQMARLMRKITECNESMERIESAAMEAFTKATGYARKNLLVEPQRYAKYSYDPLMWMSCYPLGLHILALGATEIPLRIMMRNRGFQRCSTGPVSYYYHAGTDADDSNGPKIPIVFVHGIGIGLIAYIGMIDSFLQSGRPILLPEIPYVSGFRPWESPNSVLPPAVVCSTLTDMLVTHGFLRGSFVGHSYGTSWLSYMCKYAPSAVASLVFLDPICFCLHVPRLTKKFVYHRPDPGTVFYLVRTDVNVNWTIQRSFPWAWIVLFFEQIEAPCSVFLSDCDLLVPTKKVEDYLRAKQCPVIDFEKVDKKHLLSANTTVTVLRGDGHGEWLDHSSKAAKIVECVEVVTSRAEEKENQ